MLVSNIIFFMITYSFVVHARIFLNYIFYIKSTDVFEVYQLANVTFHIFLACGH